MRTHHPLSAGAWPFPGRAPRSSSWRGLGAPASSTSTSGPASSWEDGGCRATPGQEVLPAGPGEARPSPLLPLLPGDLCPGGRRALLSHRGGPGPGGRGPGVRRVLGEALPHADMQQNWYGSPGRGGPFSVGGGSPQTAEGSRAGGWV